MTALAYWQQRYTEDAAHHSEQNQQIAGDFLKLVPSHPRFDEALRSDRIIEIGCGTGELTAMIQRVYDPPELEGTDLSGAAVDEASRRHVDCFFSVLNVLNEDVADHYDLGIASNVLEHFTDPHAVIDRIFQFADMLLAIVPYMQPVTDGYEAEGGAGHVFCFDSASFARYDVRANFIFNTDGWTYSSCGEEPRQLAILLRPK